GGTLSPSRWLCLYHPELAALLPPARTLCLFSHLVLFNDYLGNWISSPNVNKPSRFFASWGWNIMFALGVQSSVFNTLRNLVNLTLMFCSAIAAIGTRNLCLSRSLSSRCGIGVSIFSIGHSPRSGTNQIACGHHNGCHCGSGNSS